MYSQIALKSLAFSRVARSALAPWLATSALVAMVGCLDLEETGGGWKKVKDLLPDQTAVEEQEPAESGGVVGSTGTSDGELGAPTDATSDGTSDGTGEAGSEATSDGTSGGDPTDATSDGDSEFDPEACDQVQADVDALLVACGLPLDSREDEDVPVVCTEELWEREICLLECMADQPCDVLSGQSADVAALDAYVLCAADCQTVN